MNPSLKEGTIISIGSEFANILGYEEQVGNIAVIESKLTALVRVQLLTGEKFIGATFDIHHADCIPEKKQEPNMKYALAIIETGCVYYGKNLKLISFIHRLPECKGMTRLFPDVEFVSEVIDFLEEKYNDKKNWYPICIDDDYHPLAQKYRAQYDNQSGEKQEASPDLTSILMKQMRESADNAIKSIKTSKSIKPVSYNKKDDDDYQGYIRV